MAVAYQGVPGCGWWSRARKRKIRRSHLSAAPERTAARQGAGDEALITVIVMHTTIATERAPVTARHESTLYCSCTQRTRERSRRSSHTRQKRAGPAPSNLRDSWSRSQTGRRSGLLRASLGTCSSIDRAFFGLNYQHLERVASGFGRITHALAPILRRRPPSLTPIYQLYLPGSARVGKRWR